jgi:hypothetical protein
VVGVGLGRSQRCDMTPKQLAVIERARRLPTRIVQIPPRRGVRVGDAMRKLREQDTKRLSEIRSLSVHSGERPEKPQAFCHRCKSPSLKRGFEVVWSEASWNVSRSPLAMRTVPPRFSSFAAAAGRSPLCARTGHSAFIQRRARLPGRASKWDPRCSFKVFEMSF